MIYIEILEKLTKHFISKQYPFLVDNLEQYNLEEDNDFSRQYTRDFICYCVNNKFISLYDDSDIVNEKMLVLAHYCGISFEDLFFFIYYTYNNHWLRYRTDGY